MARGTTRVSVLVVALLLLGIWLVGGTRRVSRAENEPDICSRCGPVTVRAVTEVQGSFIAKDSLEAMKSAQELAYRVASERVVRKVRQSRLECPDTDCVRGREDVTTGIEESPPCRRGSLDEKTRNRKRARQRREQWRKACVETLDAAEKCDDGDVQRTKPAWAECSVKVWARKTRSCAPSRCRAPTGR